VENIHPAWESRSAAVRLEIEVRWENQMNADRFLLLLPKTGHWGLKLLLLALIIFWGGGGFLALNEYCFGEHRTASLVGAAFFLAVAVGLFRLNMWARNLTVFSLWIVVISPIGIFGPFGDMDRHHAGVDVSLTYKWIATGIIVGLGLLSLHVLGKYKSDFLRRFF
jgi:hypothetical protein